MGLVAVQYGKKKLPYLSCNLFLSQLSEAHLRNDLMNKGDL